MHLDISEIEFSRVDKKRNLKLPYTLTSELAEDIGIMVGDGCICQRQSKYEYEISVVGHLITDSVFIKNHVKRLKKKLFGIDFKFHERPEINTCLLRTCSKGLFGFYTKIIGLAVGSKKGTGIPDIIMDAEGDIKKAFLRGLADTDMTLVFKKGDKNVLHYPVIKLGSVNKDLVSDLKRILEDVGFKSSVCYDRKSYHKKANKTYITNELCLSGKDNLNRWVKEIRFSNSKNILRYMLWKEYGFSLPNEEIEKIMNGPGGTRIRGL